jgi:tripartite-type tricarboxylate transporter receptor subunit TctC
MKISLNRAKRAVVAACITAALPILAGVPGIAAAQDAAAAYPSRAIRFIVPSGAGGMLDMMGRATTDSLSKTLGQPVIVENKAGAGATLTGVTMAASKPDGHTIGIISCATLKLPHVTNASYDPLKDMTYLGRISGSQLMVAVKADAPWQTLAELLADSKKPQNKFFFGTSGSARLFAGQLADASNISSWTSVPYKGDNEAIMAVLAGDVQFIVVANTVIPMVEGKRVRVLGVFGSKKVKGHEELPTLKELGFATVDDCPIAVVGPKGMDAAVAAKLEAALRIAVETPLLQSTADKMGLPLEFVDGKTFTGAVRDGYLRDQALVKKLGLSRE